jgi:hypothetical protein
VRSRFGASTKTLWISAAIIRPRAFFSVLACTLCCEGKLGTDPQSWLSSTEQSSQPLRDLSGQSIPVVLRQEDQLDIAPGFDLNVNE